MLKYTISTLFSFCFLFAFSQGKSIDLNPKDTIARTDPYGIRVGIDLSRPLQSFLNDDYQGFEIVGDYRISSKLFLATELGNEDNTKQEDLYNFTTSGSYIKLGVDYNTYDNWYGMHNAIYVGGRYAFSSFSQTLNNYQIFDTDRYWTTPEYQNNPTEIPANGFAPGSTTPQKFSNLNASWLEAVVGIKAELFANIYLGASVRIGFLVSNKEADNFSNLWIPGFNKVTDGSNFGVGFNYSISYFLPLYKKAKKIKVTEKEKEVPEN
ncbi:hypothetical protein SAMN04487911_1477 [Arenibacter nanhaiticus]|uniref:Outer membrane protein beta-barrel domain-containing protein n=1 Tax=Arenibacter nanhaiticus TaxID=558155 RepID=A0A1M6MSV7_9FLAO|nr:DUF6048 family protein [Arenibacter nanhaiticus]SHJ86480.1 hypothetical protein SAMN04487911_1477 [Arenibacter nanhaiticus]